VNKSFVKPVICHENGINMRNRTLIMKLFQKHNIFSEFLEEQIYTV
jgi:hypothetical protein